jgi:hypothetical protein
VSLPEVHLAGEAVAALIDGELGRGAHQRALDHLAHCEECRTAVHLQRQAKSALVGAGIPTVPGDLLCRLRSVPMTADLDGSAPGQLAMAGDELVWVPAARSDPLARPGAAGRPEPVTVSPNGVSPNGTPLNGVPSNVEAPNVEAPPRRQRTRRKPQPGRPRSYPVSRTRSVRLRRGLAGTLAGLAFGVVSAAAPLGSSGVGMQQPNVVGRDPQVVPAGVGFGRLDLPARRSTGNSDRSARLAPALPAPATAPAGAVWLVVVPAAR